MYSWSRKHPENCECVRAQRDEIKLHWIINYCMLWQWSGISFRLVQWSRGYEFIECLLYIICIGMLCCLPVIQNLASFNCSGARYANPLFLHLTQREEKRKPFGVMWVGGDCRKFYIWPFSVNISVKEPVEHAWELWEKGCRSLGSCNK